ncbi:pseudaminic acid synthase [Nafulsella turpanensis]|uniref:pseudaminic acid synthase n=1 Tax=Nafulsella turpanensis TaxID=1265690 RepID=UPI0003484DE0|nr:pseudaminic acid synthase [Nafulsella turpanensis]
MNAFNIGSRRVGKGQACFIIAELSANHKQDLDIAIKTIKAAKEAGADAIKLQTYTPDTITLNSHKEYFRLQHGTIWDGMYLYDLYQEAYTPWEWHEKLFKVAEEEGLICFSSPFDASAVDLLEKLNAPAYKIASFEVMDIPLIRYTAARKKPVILSTGVAELGDIQLALQTCRAEGNDELGLLKCTSAYPAPLELSNLRTIPNLEQTFDVVPGLSDHTMGATGPVVAVSLGAKIIEKHFILDKAIGGPDAAFSMDPAEFGEMVKAVRDAEKALGQVDYSLSERTRASRAITGRSLFVVKDLKKGEVFTAEHVRSIRPGYGLEPKYLEQVLGKKATQDIEKGEPLKWTMVQ